MRLLLLLFLFLLGTTAYAARFDFTEGQPSVVDDGEVGDTFEQTQYNFTQGQPDGVFDATATPDASVTNGTIIVNNGGMIINNGTVVIQ